MADSSRTGVSYIAETTWGTTPATPTFKALRITSESLKQETETVVSEEMRPDAQVTDLIRVGARASGGVNFELSYGAYDDLLAALFRSSWTAGQGFSGASAGTDLLANGTTEQSFSIETSFAGAGFQAYVLYTGMRVNTMSLTMRPGSILTGSAEFHGKIGAVSGTTAASALTPAPTKDVLNAVDGIDLIEEGGATIANVMSLELNVTNNTRPQPALGSLSGIGVGYGRFVVTGTVEAYFRDLALYQKYLNFTASSFKVGVTDQAGNAYRIHVPRVKYSDGDVVAGGNDQDVLVRLPFQGVFDPTTTKTARMTRTPA